MAPDLGFISRNSIMHLKFSGETIDCDIKSQDRIKRKDPEKKFPLKCVLKGFRGVITKKNFTIDPGVFESTLL